MFYAYDKHELDFLRACDSKLAAAIDRFGLLQNPVEPDLFVGMVNHIISQQISWKAAQTVWQRFCDRFDPIQPQQIAETDAADLQSVGLSWRKVEYIQQIAKQIRSGELSIESFVGMPDSQVRHRLLQLPGIGDWTVDMLMIFSLQRQNIMSWHDLAIRRGLMRLHQLESIDRKQFRSYQERYSPYGTVASFYLWEIAHEIPANSDIDTVK